MGLGLKNEATQYMPDDRILATYTAPGELYGTRLEFIEGGPPARDGGVARREGMARLRAPSAGPWPVCSSPVGRGCG